MDRRATNGYARLEDREGTLYVRTQRDVEPAEYQPVQKGWEFVHGWYWFGIEEVEPGYWFGFVQGIESELGYFSEAQLDRPDIWEIKEHDLPHAGRRVVEAAS